MRFSLPVFIFCHFLVFSLFGHAQWRLCTWQVPWSLFRPSFWSRAKRVTFDAILDMQMSKSCNLIGRETLIIVLSCNLYCLPPLRATYTTHGYQDSYGRAIPIEKVVPDYIFKELSSSYDAKNLENLPFIYKDILLFFHELKALHGCHYGRDIVLFSNKEIRIDGKPFFLEVMVRERY